MGFQRHKTFASRTRTHANRPSDMFSLRWRGGAGGGFDEGSRRSRFPACGGGAWEDWCLRAVLRELHHQLLGAGGGDDLGRDGSEYGVEWALAGR